MYKLRRNMSPGKPFRNLEVQLFKKQHAHTAQDQEHFLGNPVLLFLKEATTPVAGFIFAKKKMSSHPLRCTYIQ